MSLSKPHVIDLVATLPNDQSVSLVAFDDGELLDGDSREAALQKKLVGYLQFVTGGQFLTLYPEFGDRSVRIIVVCMSPPSEGMRKVHGIRDHARPESFLPVEVTSDTEFRMGLRKRAALSKPWWKFWHERKRANQSFETMPHSARPEGSRFLAACLI